jgi:UDP-N-acetylmuramyl tripeptide synthase
LLLPAVTVETLLQRLSAVGPAFGRGETMHIAGRPLELILVKNPAGFRLSLRSFDAPAKIMIAINDHHADGRDVSWLWDVNFSSLQSHGEIAVSGTRAYDMALRLQYDDVKSADIDANLHAALERFVKGDDALPRRIFCTYTAMLAIRTQLSKLAQFRAAL